MKSNGFHGFDPAKYESFDIEDTRYYGVFIKRHGNESHIGIDPQRWEKCFNGNGGLPESVKLVMGQKDGALFRPAKKRCSDYTVNRMFYSIGRIKERWEDYKKIISSVLLNISGKAFTVSEDDELLKIGVISYDDAKERANIRTWLSSSFAKDKRMEICTCLHEAFFHQMASQAEALFLKALTESGYKGETFSRKDFYAFNDVALGSVEKLDGFAEFDKMYCIWHFLKHNSDSTFSKVKGSFPEVLKEGDYAQGNLAMNYVKFDNALFESILKGLERFIGAYCLLVFKEDPDEAGWNSDEFFWRIVTSRIREEQDPYGIDSFFGE